MGPWSSFHLLLFLWTLFATWKFSFSHIEPNVTTNERGKLQCFFFMAIYAIAWPAMFTLSFSPLFWPKPFVLRGFVLCSNFICFVFGHIWPACPLLSPQHKTNIWPRFSFQDLFTCMFFGPISLCVFVSFRVLHCLFDPLWNFMIPILFFRLW